MLSARNREALTQLAGNLRDFLVQHPQTNVADLCHTTSSGRRHFEDRAAITVNSIDDVIEKLALLSGERDLSSNGQANGNVSSNGHLLSNATPWNQNVCHGTPKIAWLLDSDARSQNSDLATARELFTSEPLFRELMVEFDQVLTDHAEKTGQPKVPLLTVLQDGSQSPEPSDVYQFALQSGLAKILQTWGITPDAVLGFGVGQYTAACVTGSLCFKDALLLVVMREQVLNSLPQHSPETNGQTIEESELDQATQNALEQFESFADSFNYYPPNLPLICSIDGTEVPVHRSLGGSYWRRHCLAGQSRTESYQTLNEMNCDYVVDLNSECHSDSTVQEMKNAISAKQLSCLTTNQPAVTALHNVLGQLYVGGSNPTFSALGKNQNRISLPPYPFQKKRFWITEVGQFVDAQHQIETVKN